MALSKTTFTDYSTVISADFLNTLQDEVINGIGYGTCATAAATKAKTVSISDFTLETGATVRVKFTYTNTASAPTLNVNDTGAASIARYGTTAAGATVSESWRAGQVVTFVYDGTYWQMADYADKTNDVYTASTSVTDSTYGLTFNLYRYGGTCILGISGTPSTDIPTGWYSVTTLDSDYYPPFLLPYATMVCQNDTSYKMLVSLDSSGLLRINPLSNAIPAGYYFNSFMTYPAKLS